MTILLLIYEFFKTGLFAIGGGLATLPFLAQMSARHPEWFSAEMLANMVAISESTPGPLGVNLATYAGYHAAGIAGAVAATLALVAPSVIVIILAYKVILRHKDSRPFQDSFAGLRPAVTGLIAAAGFTVFRMAVLNGTGALAPVNVRALALFAALLAVTQWKRTAKLHPVVLIAVGAVCGLLIEF